MSSTEPVKVEADDPGIDPHMLAHPQEGYQMLRSVAPVMPMDNMGVGTSATMVLVAGEAEVREVLKHPETFSSNDDAVHIGQVRPLIPLQIDPPDHKTYRKILDPLFSPRRGGHAWRRRHRRSSNELIDEFVDGSHTNFHASSPSRSRRRCSSS